MPTPRRFLPDEWATAAHALLAMNRAGPAYHFVWKNLLGFAVPFAAGLALALVLLPDVLEADKGLLLTLAGGVLAFCAILIGFGATLMLFTGRIDRPEELSLEQLRAYSTRIRYLLASQGLTLFVALGTALATLIWTLLVTSESPYPALLWVGALACGLAGVCIVRTALLPLQIFELHEAWLVDQLSKKEAEIAKRYSNSGR